ncbi:hypothetical protein FPV67DRAFT_1500779 [Lyophyllum atratum]|nr:hypothetical protein FPV67DRAFT_1500779 [Lyophyllum atratum]
MPPKSKSSGGIFGKLVAIRSKRVSTPAPPLKESDRSVLALVSRSVPLSTIAATSACTDNANNNFGQAVSTTVARINSEGRRDSFAHKARDYAISGLTVIQPIADAVPVVGSPIKAAVGTLLEVLKAIDRMSQNNDDIEALKEKLYRLDGRISAMPAARSSSIAKLRDELTRYLTETSKRLKAACSYSTLRYSTIAQDVNRCSTDIDHFLIEYSTLSNMWLENYVEGFRNEMSSMRGFMSMTMKAIRLVDATGRDHAIPMSLAGSYEQFDQAIQILFLRGTADDTVKDRVLRGYTKRARRVDGQEFSRGQQW